ncbi:MAG: response regulator [Ghiorsea sp.]
MSEQQSNPFAGTHILLADDDLVFRMMLRKYLEGEGYVVSDADDGDVAVAKFTENPVDLVLMDAFMPKMDGLEAAGLIKALPQGKDIPILMVSSLDDDDLISVSFEHGITDFVTKPINWNILGNRVRIQLQALSNQRDLDQLRQTT